MIRYKQPPYCIVTMWCGDRDAIKCASLDEALAMGRDIKRQADTGVCTVKVKNIYGRVVWSWYNEYKG